MNASGMMSFGTASMMSMGLGVGGAGPAGAMRADGFGDYNNTAAGAGTGSHVAASNSDLDPSTSASGVASASVSAPFASGHSAVSAPDAFLYPHPHHHHHQQLQQQLAQQPTHIQPPEHAFTYGTLHSAAGIPISLMAHDPNGPFEVDVGAGAGFGGVGSMGLEGQGQGQVFGTGHGVHAGLSQQQNLAHPRSHPHHHSHHPQHQQHQPPHPQALAQAHPQAHTHPRTHHRPLAARPPNGIPGSLSTHHTSNLTLQMQMQAQSQAQAQAQVPISASARRTVTPRPQSTSQSQGGGLAQVVVPSQAHSHQHQQLGAHVRTQSFPHPQDLEQSRILASGYGTQTGMGPGQPTRNQSYPFVSQAGAGGALNSTGIHPLAHGLGLGNGYPVVHQHQRANTLPMAPSLDARAASESANQLLMANQMGMDVGMSHGMVQMHQQGISQIQHSQQQQQQQQQLQRGQTQSLAQAQRQQQQLQLSEEYQEYMAHQARLGQGEFERERDRQMQMQLDLDAMREQSRTSGLLGRHGHGQGQASPTHDVRAHSGHPRQNPYPHPHPHPNPHPHPHPHPHAQTHAHTIQVPSLHNRSQSHSQSQPHPQSQSHQHSSSSPSSSLSPVSVSVGGQNQNQNQSVAGNTGTNPTMLGWPPDRLGHSQVQVQVQGQEVRGVGISGAMSVDEMRSGALALRSNSEMALGHHDMFQHSHVQPQTQSHSRAQLGQGQSQGQGQGGGGEMNLPMPLTMTMPMPISASMQGMTDPAFAHTHTHSHGHAVNHSQGHGRHTGAMQQLDHGMAMQMGNDVGMSMPMGSLPIDVGMRMGMSPGDEPMNWWDASTAPQATDASQSQADNVGPGTSLDHTRIQPAPIPIPIPTPGVLDTSMSGQSIDTPPSDSHSHSHSQFVWDAERETRTRAQVHGDMDTGSPARTRDRDESGDNNSMVGPTLSGSGHGGEEIHVQSQQPQQGQQHQHDSTNIVTSTGTGQTPPLGLSIESECVQRDVDLGHLPQQQQQPQSAVSNAFGFGFGLGLGDGNGVGVGVAGVNLGPLTGELISESPDQGLLLSPLEPSQSQSQNPSQSQGHAPSQVQGQEQDSNPRLDSAVIVTGALGDSTSARNADYELEMDEWIRYAQSGGGTVGVSVGNAWNVAGAGSFATMGHGHAVDVSQTWSRWEAQQDQAQANMPFNTQAQQGRQEAPVTSSGANLNITAAGQPPVSKPVTSADATRQNANSSHSNSNGVVSPSTGTEPLSVTSPSSGSANASSGANPPTTSSSGQSSSNPSQSHSNDQSKDTSSQPHIGSNANVDIRPKTEPVLMNLYTPDPDPETDPLYKPWLEPGAIDIARNAGRRAMGEDTYLNTVSEAFAASANGANVDVDATLPQRGLRPARPVDTTGVQRYMDMLSEAKDRGLPIEVILDEQRAVNRVMVDSAVAQWNLRKVWLRGREVEELQGNAEGSENTRRAVSAAAASSSPRDATASEGPLTHAEYEAEIRMHETVEPYIVPTEALPESSFNRYGPPKASSYPRQGRGPEYSIVRISRRGASRANSRDEAGSGGVEPGSGVGIDNATPGSSSNLNPDHAHTPITPTSPNILQPEYSPYSPHAHGNMHTFPVHYPHPGPLIRAADGTESTLILDGGKVPSGARTARPDLWAPSLRSEYPGKFVVNSNLTFAATSALGSLGAGTDAGVAMAVDDVDAGQEAAERRNDGRASQELGDQSPTAQASPGNPNHDGGSGNTASRRVRGTAAATPYARRGSRNERAGQTLDLARWQDMNEYGFPADAVPPGTPARAAGRGRGGEGRGRRTPRVKPAPKLACHFCRNRKIACGRGTTGNGDICNQCERRSITCTYPEHSRRGMRTRKKDKEPESTSPTSGVDRPSNSAPDEILQQQVQAPADNTLENDSDVDAEQVIGEDDDQQDVDMGDQNPLIVRAPNHNTPPTQDTSPEFVEYSGYHLQGTIQPIPAYLPQNELQA